MQHDDVRPSSNNNLRPESEGFPGESLEDQPYKDDQEREAHMSPQIKRGTGTWVLVGVVLFAIALGAAFYQISHRRAAQEKSLENQTATDVNAPPPVNVVPVEYAPANHVIVLPGETHAWYETTIYARVNGYVQKWFVDIGDKVHEGQVLATIETPELDQQLAAALGKVAAADAQIKLAQANAHFSEVTYARYKDAPKGMVSDLERDQKDADYQTSLARVTSAQSDLNSAQAEVDQLKAMIAFKQVTAPFDGVITERRVDIGNLVTAGSTASTTSLFKIVQPDPMRVVVDVPEQMEAQIRDGSDATITAREYPGRKFIGRVARNANAISTGAKTLHVEVDVPNHDFALLSGMYVEVNFQIDDAKPMLEVPASAMDFRSGGPQVAVVSKDGHVTFRNVTISRDMGTVVEIGAGLEPNERVAMNISNQISNGDRVSPIDVDAQGRPLTGPAPAVAAAAGTAHSPVIQTSSRTENDP